MSEQKIFIMDFGTKPELEFKKRDEKAEVEQVEGQPAPEQPVIVTRGANALADFFYFAMLRHFQFTERGDILKLASLRDKVLAVTEENPTFEVTQAELDWMTREYENTIKEGATQIQDTPMGPQKVKFKFSALELDFLEALELAFEGVTPKE